MTGAEPGYLSPAFGQSYGDFGTPVRLPASGLQLLRRPLGPDSWDYIGPYPYAMCTDWSALDQDLSTLAIPGAVSLTFVADPFATGTVQKATRGWDLCRPFKTHYVADLTADWRRSRPKEMRRIARRALETHEMEIVAEGIETIEQVRTVREAGCTLGQGYYFSRAVPDYLATMLLAREQQTTDQDQRVAS